MPGRACLFYNLRPFNPNNFIQRMLPPGPDLHPKTSVFGSPLDFFLSSHHLKVRKVHLPTPLALRSVFSLFSNSDRAISTC